MPTTPARCPGFKALNLGLASMSHGATVAIDLVVVYMIGAELYIDEPIWLAITALQRTGKLMQCIRNLQVSWIGGLI